MQVSGAIPSVTACQFLLSLIYNASVSGCHIRTELHNKSSKFPWLNQGSKTFQPIEKYMENVSHGKFKFKFFIEENLIFNILPYEVMVSLDQLIYKILISAFSDETVPIQRSDSRNEKFGFLKNEIYNFNLTVSELIDLWALIRETFR